MNRSQVNQLVQCFQKLLSGQPAPKRRRQRRRRTAAAVQPQLMAGPAPKPQRVRRPRPNAGLAQGEVRLARTELLYTVASSPIGSAIFLAPDNLPWLKNLAKAFERYKFHKLVIEYRPLVGTTQGGSIALGIDWASASTTADMDVDSDLYVLVGAAPTKAKVMACTPSIDMPSWQSGKLVVPASRLMSRAWYELGTIPTDTSVYDFGPGFLAQISSLASSGEIWLHYDITMTGTKPV